MVRIKSVDSRLCSNEEKDLEMESEELATGHPVSESEDNESGIECAVFCGLSLRASQMKEYLSRSGLVKAVLLRSDGSSEEISYDGTSVGTRKLLQGRPSIIGEIEDLQVVAVQSMSTFNGMAYPMAGGVGVCGAVSAQNRKQNQHTLPVPLCNNKSHGDLVLFRVDGGGAPSDLTLQEYQQYVDAHKTLTATAVKNYSADGEQIQSNSPFSCSAKMSMKSLRGALETQIVAMAGDDEATKKSDAEIEAEVMEGLQKLVDEAVASLSVSPMEDPDYEPEEEGMDESADLEVVGNGLGIEEVDDELESPWIEQLKDALNHVRRIGKADGAAFAEMVCSTFYELNGSEPSLNKLTDLYSRIKKDFANEAAEELQFEEDCNVIAESDNESDDFVEDEDAESDSVGVEIRSDSADDMLMDYDCSWQSAVDCEWKDTLDHIRDIARKDGRSLAENACDLFYDVNGDEPTLEELTQLWQLIQDELAAEAEAEADAEEELDSVSGDYTAADSMSSSDCESQADGDEVDGDETADDYDPNNAADHLLAQKDAAEDKKHEIENFDEVVLNTPIVTANNGVSWNMYFNEGDLNEEAESSKLVKTLEGFKMMNRREPTPLEVRKMKMFLSVPNDLVDDEDAMKTELAMMRTGGGASWSLYYDESGSTQSSSGSLEKAIKSFVQFHERQPTNSEVQQIRSFLSLESESISISPLHIEADYKTKIETKMVMTQQSGCSDIELKESDDINGMMVIDSNSRSDSTKLMMQLVTKKVVTKKAATGYTLNFEDDEKRDIGDEEEAMKWFKRFNHREPSNEEKQQIKQFVKGDQEEEEEEEEEEMVDIE